MKRRKDNTWLIIAAIYVAIILLSIGVTAALVKIVCWAFGFMFSWKLAIGVWVVLMLISGAVKSTSSK